MAQEQFTNNATTSLNGGINNSVTSLTATSATGFPASSQYRILIDTEIMIVTAGAGTTTWTVTRGAEGTTAASHADGGTISHILTAGSLSNWLSATVNATGTEANIFSANASNAGGIYIATDTGTIFRSDGTNMTPIYWSYDRVADPSIYSNLRRNVITTTLTPVAGTLYLGGTIIPKNTTVSFLGTRTGTTAAIIGTTPHWWLSLHDSSGNLLAWTGDQTNAAIAASSNIEVAITKNAAGGTISSYTTAATDLFLVGIMIQTGTGGTQPTLQSATGIQSTALALTPVTGQKAAFATGGTSQTTPPPNPAVLAGSASSQPYLWTR